MNMILYYYGEQFALALFWKPRNGWTIWRENVIKPFEMSHIYV